LTCSASPHLGRLRTSGHQGDFGRTLKKKGRKTSYSQSHSSIGGLPGEEEGKTEKVCRSFAARGKKGGTWAAGFSGGRSTACRGRGTPKKG